MDTAISIRKLTKNYDAVNVLKAIDLDVAGGRFVILLGPSGCGKTTLLRAVSGITQPSSGEIWFKNRRIDGLTPERRNFGMVFQTYALFPHMTVSKNVAFGLEMRGVGRSEIVRRVGAALELVGLSTLADRLPKQLSGGQQQRVALARAIVIEPDMLLFDEPLSNLDAKLRDDLREELRALQRKLGVTSIYVTHDQAEAMALADEIVVMRDGRIVERGAPIELYRRPSYRFTAEFLGLTNVLDVEIDRGICRLPWGAVRPLENPDETNVEGVAVRPEDLAIEATDDDGDGVVEQSMFMGASIHYWVSAGGRTVRVIATGGRTSILPAGRRVRLTPPPALHLLRTLDTAEGGRA